MLEQRALGRTGLTVGPIGLGCGNWGREIDEESSWQVMDYAVENGISFFDTGEGYGGGQTWATRKAQYGTEDRREVTLEMSSSEAIIGRWMRARATRDRITLCTKVSTGGSPENIHRALAGSLERLGTDHVDVYKLHAPDPETPVGETLAALTEEADAGRTAAIGCSNHSAEQLQAALEASEAGGYRRYDVLQPMYNLVRPESEDELFPLCVREEIAITSFSPLGAGFLTGKYSPDRSKFPEGSRYHIMPGHADAYFSDRNFEVLGLLQEKGKELGIPGIRLAMAWAMTNPAITLVLIGARNPEQVDNALAAHDLGLDPELRAEMSSWTRAPGA